MTIRQFIKGMTPNYLVERYTNKRRYNIIKRFEKIRDGIAKDMYLFQVDDSPFFESVLNGGFEVDIVSRMPEYVKGTEIILDVGANIGIYELYLHRLFPDAKIVALEPNRYNREILCSTLEINNLAHKVEVLPYALADINGIMKFQDTDGFSTMGRLHEKGNVVECVKSDLNACPIVDVETRTLDWLVEEQGLGSVDLIKVDVEGCEYFMLMGATSTIKKYKPRLLVEIHTVEAALKCSELLASWGYKWEILTELPEGRREIIAWHVEDADNAYMN